MIDFGTTVLTYNQWTGYENNDVSKYFRRATDDDIQNLKPGDAIWIDEESIHPNGKVYGFIKRKVDRVKGKNIHHDGGFTTLHDTIFFVDDEAALAELVVADPRITDAIGDSGRAAMLAIKKFRPGSVRTLAKSLRAIRNQNA